MKDYRQIQAESDEAAKEAARENMESYVPFDLKEIENYPPFRFPTLGNYIPKGWNKVDELFCDASGFGSDNEPALSPDQLRKKLLSLETTGKQYGYGITRIGQFQLYLGVFEKRPIHRKRAR